MSTSGAMGSFAAELRQLRSAADITQMELAERAGLSLNAVSALERGERKYPYSHTVQALASALDLSGDKRSRLMHAARRTPATTTVQMAPSAGLPVVTTSFVGRAHDAATALAFIAAGDGRLITFTGPGGVGKTRLALHVAQEAGADARDGARFISLATLTDSTQVIPTIANGLGLTGDGNRIALLQRYLDDHDLVLLLDNFEQVVSAAPDIAHVLVGAPRLRLLVTSRSPLRIEGEQEFPVRPLPLPHINDLQSIEALADSPAVRLFVLRARAVRPDFMLTEENGVATASLCQRLDGLPLAIELAASRVRLLSPQAMLERMPQALSLLADGHRDRPVRHQSLRATIDWSYSLLTSTEQALFRLLTVFAGGCSLEAVEAVGLAIGTGVIDDSTSFAADAVLEQLTALIDHSLIQQEALPGGEVRISMLETIRVFGLERLVEAGEDHAAGAAHAEYYRTLVSACRTQLEGPRRRDAHNVIRRDLDNVRAALTWYLDHGDGVTAQHMGFELGMFWIAFGLLDEGHQLLARMLALPGTPESRYQALYRASIVAQLQAAREASINLARQALAAARDYGDPVAIGTALAHLGEVTSDDDPDTAETMVRESIELMGDTGNPFLEGIMHRQLALIALKRRDSARAATEHTAALEWFRKMDHRWGVPISLRGLAEVALASGDLVTSRQRFLESIACWRDLGEHVHMSDCLLGLAQIHTRSGDRMRAGRLLGAREKLDRSMGFVHLRETHDQLIEDLRRDLGPDAFALAWHEGRTSSLDAMIDDELAGFAASDPGPQPG